MPSTIDRLKTQFKASLFHKRVIYLSKRAWRQRHNKVFTHNPDYRRACPPEIESAHRILWKPLRSDLCLDTLRVCYGISGKAVAEIIPEEIYVSEIEPCLNHHPESRFLENKNFFNRWLLGDLFPEVFVHNIDGDFYNGKYERFTPTALRAQLARLPYPVVLKPSLGPGGGRGVSFVSDPEALAIAMGDKQDFVVQALIRQHNFFAQFNPSCLNTLRVCTYRSVTDNQVHVLNVTMRMGKGGSLDNETAGGIVCNIHDDGTLNHYAVDKYGVKFSEHPDTHLRFTDHHIIPQFESLQQITCRVAQDIYLTRLVSFDVTMDEKGRWRLIEWNLFDQTIRFAQYAGKPFFGHFTDEVIDYCRRHPEWR